MSRLLVEKNGPVWIGKFNNPPHSYMDQLTAEALADFLDEVDASDEVRVVVLTGNEPDIFIRHYDASVLLERGQNMAKRGMTFSLDRLIPESSLHQTLARMESSPIPFIAAINGTAMGGGFELALACDLRLVQDGPYHLGLPEVNIGLLAGGGGTQRLPRLIGQSRALELELLGRTLSPQQAVQYGVAANCVDADVLLYAQTVAASLAKKSAAALAHIKYLIKGSAEWSLAEGLAKERTLFCDLMTSDKSLNEVTRFVNSETLLQDWK
jgi:enoyl-CoA hydratase/carnithine racemase